MLTGLLDMLAGPLDMVNVSRIKLNVFMGALRGLLNIIRQSNRVPDMLIGCHDMLIGPQAILACH
jgi:hypothetical protein